MKIYLRWFNLGLNFNLGFKFELDGFKFKSGGYNFNPGGFNF